jgi:hypothetical protein
VSVHAPEGGFARVQISIRVWAVDELLAPTSARGLAPHVMAETLAPDPPGRRIETPTNNCRLAEAPTVCVQLRVVAATAPVELELDASTVTAART